VRADPAETRAGQLDVRAPITRTYASMIKLRSSCRFSIYLVHHVGILEDLCVTRQQLVSENYYTARVRQNFRRMIDSSERMYTTNLRRHILTNQDVLQGGPSPNANRRHEETTLSGPTLSTVSVWAINRGYCGFQCAGQSDQSGGRDTSQGWEQGIQSASSEFHGA